MRRTSTLEVEIDAPDEVRSLLRLEVECAEGALFTFEDGALDPVTERFTQILFGGWGRDDGTGPRIFDGLDPQFVLSDLRPNLDCTLLLRGPRDHGVVLRERIRTPMPGLTERVKLPVDLGLLHLRGEVRDARGLALGGVSVSIRQRDAEMRLGRSGSDGRYEIALLKGAALPERVWIAKPGYLGVYAKLTREADGVLRAERSVLHAARRLDLRLSDAVGTVLQPSGAVARDLRGEARGQFRRSRSRIDDLPFEPLRVALRFGGVTYERRVGATQRELKIRLPEHGTLAIEVGRAGPEYAPEAGREVVVRRRDDDAAVFTTRIDQPFQRALLPGRYRMMAGERELASFEVRAGETCTVKVAR